MKVMKQHLGKFFKLINWKAVFTPSITRGVHCFSLLLDMLVFEIFCIFQTHTSTSYGNTSSFFLMTGAGTTAPLRVIQDSASFVGRRSSDCDIDCWWQPIKWSQRDRYLVSRYKLY